MAAVDKDVAARMLEEIATLLELKGENLFKVRAYRNAARSLEGQPEDLKTLVESGKLETLEGVGEAISKKIRELFAKGRLAYYEDLKKEFPAGILELLRVQGLGPKKVKHLYEELKIRSLAELEQAARKGLLSKVAGFGAKSQENILKGLAQLKKSEGLFMISSAQKEADKLVAHLKKQKVALIEVAGSLRRHKELVRDIDILASAQDPAALHKAFVGYAEVQSVLAHGDTKSSVLLKSGMQCDLRTVSDKEFPYALLYFTGSKAHNVALRTISKKAGIKINEYGLFRGSRRLACKDEREIYEKLGFHYIPPELREDLGELEAAKKGELPELVEDKDIRGVFHVHSTYSDGAASLADMIAEAERLGHEYVGISDHSQSAAYANGLKPERLKAQRKELDALVKKRRIRVFWGTECDILADGRMDYSDDILKGFDFVIGSIHSHFQLGEKEQTARLLRAMECKYLTFIGHPTGRLLLNREGYPVDMPKVLEAAGKARVAVELNANPHRLDLDWRLGPYAKKCGVRIGIHPDAHSLEGLQDTTYGVGIARKGHFEKADVVNALGVAAVEKYLKQRR